MVSAEEVDELGILGATEKAMQLAVADLAQHVTPTLLLVDGRDTFWFDYPHISIIRGDQTEKCISAASIIAKVTRDRFMIEQSRKYPNYFFDQHKGYGTQKHCEAIMKHGSCPLHRMSFLKRLLQQDHSLRVPVAA